MGQCGCGDRPFSKAHAIKRGVVLAYKLYAGCEDCFQGIAAEVSVFNSKKSEWLDHLKIEDGPKPDEFGGNHGRGLAFGILDVDGLRAEAKELLKEAPLKDYRGKLDDWLADYGLRLIQGAVRRFAAKPEET